MKKKSHTKDKNDKQKKLRETKRFKEVKHWHCKIL